MVRQARLWPLVTNNDAMRSNRWIQTTLSFAGCLGKIIGVIFAAALLTILVLGIFSAYNRWQTYLPRLHGSWESADAGLFLDITRYGAASGTYVENSEEVKVVAFINPNSGRLEIWRELDLTPTGARPRDDYAMYSGSYRVRRGQFHVRLDQRTQERTGLTEIVLERIG